MPPKAKFNREEIVSAAMKIVRKEGGRALTARALAAELGTSTAPIFTAFTSIDDLTAAVKERAEALYASYLARGMEHPLPFKGAGLAYIRFAKEERELFRLLYMRDRSEEEPSALQMKESMASLVTQATGLAGDEGKLFHLEMWAYVHGIAAMLATGFLELEEDLIAAMITDCYQGLRKQHKKEG